MALIDDVADWISSQVTTISLHDNAGVEVSGGGYARLAPTYAPAAAGVTDLSSPLAYDGPSGSQVTHYRLQRAAGAWSDLIPFQAAFSFNSDNRADVTSAPINLALI